MTADGAHDGRACRDAIALRGAEAVIPPRRNAKPWKKDSPGAAARNEALRAIKRLGRTLWRRWSGYHRRSRAETKMNCLKLLGQKLMSRDFDRQTAERPASASPSSTAPPPSAFPSRGPSDDVKRGKGKSVRQAICTTRPLSKIKSGYDGVPRVYEAISQ